MSEQKPAAGFGLRHHQRKIVRRHLVGGLSGSSESGSGGVLVVALCAALIAVTLTLVPLLGVFVAHQQASGAADAAALAAADTASGRIAGDPCATAQFVAEANGATLVSCQLVGLETEVTVAIQFGAVQLTERARAGPPPGS